MLAHVLRLGRLTELHCPALSVSSRAIADRRLFTVQGPAGGIVWSRADKPFLARDLPVEWWLARSRMLPGRRSASVVAKDTWRVGPGERAVLWEGDRA